MIKTNHLLSFLLFVCFGIQTAVAAEEYFNLEDIAQDFILETHRIVVPKYPHAFNPSIVEWNGRLLLSFRIIDESNSLDRSQRGKSNGSDSTDSYIGLVWLDHTFTPIGEPHILPLDEYDYAHSEDARLIPIGNQLFLTYSSNNNRVITEGGFRMCVAIIDCDEEGFHILHKERLVVFDGENPQRREKNWVPFSYNNELCFAYSLTPHKILKPLLDGSGCCQTSCTSRGSIVWEWGELRGGTPALFDEEQQEYLAFFHSCVMIPSEHSGGKSVLHYFIGAYTFSKHPPFEIRQISPEPIIGKNFYQGKEYLPYWQPVRVVFPCGYISDGPYVWISYGRQDHELWVVKIDKKGLYQTLIQVSTRSGK